MQPLILCWLTVPKATPLQLLETAASAGFASVGMRILEAGEPDTAFVGGGGESAALVKRAADDLGVTIFRTAGFRIDGRYTPDRFRPYIEATAELGAEYISIIATDQDEQRRHESFGSICEEAAACGLRISVEFTPFSAVKTIFDCYELLVKAGRPDSAILLDALHLYRSGGKANDVLGIPQERLAVAQLCDARVNTPKEADLLWEARNDRFDVGKGKLPLRDFMSVLPHSIPLEVETPCLLERDLPVIDRARNAARITREFLADYSEMKE